MPSTRAGQPQMQLTISLAEVDDLRSKVVDLEGKVLELTTENESLKAKLHDLTDPAKQADAKAFRNRRSLS